MAADEGVVTGDMVAQQTYCPRRLHLMYAEGRWASNVHTDEGEHVHRRVDAGDGLADAAAEDDSQRPPRTRPSVMLEHEGRRLRAKLDQLEVASNASTVPVEFKKGKGRDLEAGPWPADRIQLGFQALLLRLNGRRCDEGIVYYASTRTRHRVAIDDALMGEVEGAIVGVRDTLARTESPEPLDDSRKCDGCSLAGICLPDETNLLASRGPANGPSKPSGRVRRLVPPRDDALPLYVQEQGARVGKRGESLVVSKGKEKLASARLLDVSQLVLLGNVGITPQANALLCEAGVPIVHLSRGHWFYGITAGTSLRNAFDRAAQFEFSRNEVHRLELARSIVGGKGKNQRTLLRRNGRSGAPVLAELRRTVASINRAKSIAELRGYEGQIAALYFGAFSTMLRPPEPSVQTESSTKPTLPFEFRNRNRRPPRDPVNAMLSFGYAMLAKEATVSLLAAGLDPYWGMYHEPRHGRPSLALDLMEEFRPLIVDSAVLTAVNTGAVGRADFRFASNGCALTSSGRKAFLRAYEARMDQLVTHPVFDYRVSWRRVLKVQAQLLARVFRGSIPEYLPIVTR